MKLFPILSTLTVLSVSTPALAWTVEQENTYLQATKNQLYENGYGPNVRTDAQMLELAESSCNFRNSGGDPMQSAREYLERSLATGTNPRIINFVAGVTFIQIANATVHLCP